MGLRWTECLCTLLATGLVAPPASATITLIADGTLTGSAAGPNADLSGLTGTLQNGLPANLLGGLGSGLAYAGGSTFLAVPERDALRFEPRRRHRLLHQPVPNPDAERRGAGSALYLDP